MSVASVKRRWSAQFLATIPRQRPIRLGRQLTRVLDQRIDHRLRVLAVDLHHHLARAALDQCGDLTVAP